MTVRALALTVLLAFTALALALPTPATARQPDPQTDAEATHAALEVELTRVDAVATTPEQRVTVVARLRNTGDETIRGAEAVLAAHGGVSSRFGLARALDARDGPGGPVLGRVQRAVTDVPPGAVRYVALSGTLADLGVTRRRAVHPLRLEIAGRIGTGPPIALARRTTALVVMTAEVGVPLTTTLGVVFPAPVQGEGRVDAGELTDLARGLRAVDAPISVVLDPALTDNVVRPDPSEAEGAGGDGEGAEPTGASAPPSPDPSTTEPTPSPGASRTPGDAATAASPAVGDTLQAELERLLADPGVERLLLPYARADLVALHRHGAGARADVALRAGWPDGGARIPAVVPPAGLDARTLTDVVAPLRPGAVVVGEPYLALDPTQEQPTSPTPVRRLLTTSGQVTGVVPDPWLQPRLGDLSTLTPSAVQRVVADSAMLYLERPGSSRTRGLFLLAGGAGIVDVAGGLDGVSGGQPARAAALAGALADVPWLELASVDTLVRDVAPAEPVRLTYPEQARAAELPAGYVADLRAAEEDVDALTRLLDEASTEITDLRRTLLMAGSTAFRDDRPAGRALIAEVAGATQGLFSSVEVRRQPTVTFTDDAGQLPVLVANRSPLPLTVRVQLSSRRLEFGDNDREVVLDPDTTTTIVFATRARTPGGTAPVVVDVTDPSGQRELARGSIIVRIASYPLMGILLLVGAGVVLLLWGLREWSRRGPGDGPAGGDLRAGAAP